MFVFLTVSNNPVKLILESKESETTTQVTLQIVLFILEVFFHAFFVNVMLCNI